MRARQVIIAFGTLLTLATAYILYSSTFGRLTDFPQLAANLREPMALDGSQELTKPAIRESEVGAVRGFGPNCAQVAAPLILESRRKGDKALPVGRGIGMFVYADTYEIPPENQNQIRLRPFSLVHISESKDGNPDHDEIMTVFAEQAVLEFDKPIELTKLSGLHPLVGWVQGDVTLKTNRRTVDPSDDIVVFTERLHYDRSKQLIWADDTVKIVVEKEGTITGDGLEVELYSEEEHDKAEEKKRAEAKSAKLLKNVRFDLLLSSDEDFLGGGPNANGMGPIVNPEAALEKTTRDKTNVVVQARGPFTFDLENNLAKFENSVQVLRRNPSENKEAKDSIDQLEADMLTLEFMEGAIEGTGDKPASDKEKGLSVKRAIATGTQVILLSESQKLQATGNRLEFDGQSHTVTLQGEKEMIAVKDNAVIHAQKFRLKQSETGNSKLPQKIEADGPEAWMDLIETTAGTPTDIEKGRRLHISWQNELVMTRKADSESYEFVITGGVELEHETGALTCKQLQGLLVPVEDPANVAAGATAKKRYEPLRLEAEGNVSFHSEKVDVGAETLIMHILNRRPDVAAAKPAEEAAPKDMKEGVAAAPAIAPATPRKRANEPKDALADAQVRKPEEPESSLNLTARTVTIVVEKIGSNSRPVSAWAEGNVKVSQPPKNPEDRPLEIVGNLLEYERKADGDVMTIKGTDKSFAEIRSADMMMAARHAIVLNESTNRVEIAGPGYLTMNTSASLNGKKLEKPLPARVEWDDMMNFDGRIAYFEGKVVATQETAEMHSHTMEVTFDRKIEFKQLRAGEKKTKEKEPAAESVYCERDVEVYNREMENGALVRQTRVLSQQLRFDNIEHEMMIDGTGNITIVEPSKPRKDGRGRMVPPELPFRVTIVEFGERMTGQEVSKTIKFYGGVKIVSVPVADPGKAIDESALPEEGFIINSRQAEMAVTQEQDGKKFQLFNASENVVLEARDYRATCGRLGFDEQKGWLVLDGERDRAARLHRQTKAGQPPESFAGKTIRLNPATKEIRTDGSEGINSLELGRPARPVPERR